MKCEKCNSSLLFVDAENDKVWCKSCGYTENVDYNEQNKQNSDNKKYKVTIDRESDVWTTYAESAELAQKQVVAQFEKSDRREDYDYWVAEVEEVKKDE